MDTEEPSNDQLLELLAICEGFFAGTSPDTRRELDALLQGHAIIAGPGWLIDMIALERLRLKTRESSGPTTHLPRRALLPPSRRM